MAAPAQTSSYSQDQEQQLTQTYTAEEGSEAAQAEQMSPDSRFRGLGKTRFAFCVAPVAYVWCLPLLVDVPIHEADDGAVMTYAHKCPGYPACNDSVGGVGVLDMIATPQATGAFCATFFFPTMYLWLPGAVLEGEPCAYPTLLVFQVSASCVVTFSALMKSNGGMLIPEVICSIAGLMHYAIMLRHCHRARLMVSRFVLIIMNCALASLCIASVSAMLTDFGETLKSCMPWLFFTLESTALSAIAMFPLFWYRDTALELSEHRSARSSDLPLGHSIYSMGNSNFPLKALGTVLPIIYVWSLPLMASQDVFAHRCRDFPYCKEKHGHAQGESISDMICTPMATGAMAATFFWPTMHFWMPGAQAPDSKVAYRLLVLFQVCFGLFMMCPVVYVPPLHFAIVTVFCVSIVAHLTFTLWHCMENRLKWCAACLIVAMAMLALLGIIMVVASIDRHFYERSRFHAWIFYICEATGLSAGASFPIVWRRRERCRNARPSVVSPTFTTLRG